MKTYFILGRKQDSNEQIVSETKATPSTSPPTHSNSVLFAHTPPPPTPPRPTSVPLPAIALPPTPTPNPISILPSSPFRRDRVYSCHVTSRPHPATSYLAMTPMETRTTSLPSIMDSGKKKIKTSVIRLRDSVIFKCD